MWETDTFFSPFQSVSSTEVWNSRHGQETRQCHNTCHWGWCQWRGNDPDSSRWSGHQWQWGHAGNQLLGLRYCTGQRQKRATAISCYQKYIMQPFSAWWLLLAVKLGASLHVSFLKQLSATSILDVFLGFIIMTLYYSGQSSTSPQSLFPSDSCATSWSFSKLLWCKPFSLTLSRYCNHVCKSLAVWKFLLWGVSFIFKFFPPPWFIQELVTSLELGRVFTLGVLFWMLFRWVISPNPIKFSTNYFS